MDKNLHKDIGDWFHEHIEPLSQTPKKHVWENLEHQLDKTDASKYKNKFINIKKIAAFLFLLLVSFATFTLLYINKTKENILSKDDNQFKNKLDSNKDLEKSNKEKKVNNYISGISQNPYTFNNKSSKIEDGKKAGNTIKLINQNNTKVKPGYSMRPVTNEDLNARIAEPGSSFLRNKAVRNTKDKSLILSQVDIDISNQPGSTSLLKSPYSFFGGSLKDILTEPKISLQIIPLNKKISFPVSETNHSIVKSNSRKIISPPKHSITTFIAPEFAGYILEDDEINPYDNKQIIEKREKHLLSKSGGVLINSKINNHLNFQAGVIYSYSDISIDPSVIYAVNDEVGNIKYRYNTSSGFGYVLPSFNSSPAVGDSLYTRTTNHTLQYLSIPVILNYNFGKGNLSFNPGIGIAFNFLMKSTLHTEVRNSLGNESESITKLRGLKKIGYSLVLTPELHYKLSAKWSLVAIPYFKYALKPINKGYLVRTYPYNAGIGIGINYKL